MKRGVGARLMDGLRDVVQTAFRLVPWPTEAGLRAVGEPDERSPVIVTGNYALTVRRVLRALEGVDAWVVVAPTHGINVWCAASGGHFTTHQVVMALKTSGVADRVTHRRAVLPQLAATGVRGRDVTHRTGWKVLFGPVYAADLPRYLDAHNKKSEDMRRVRFGAPERLEMAAAWAVPSALVIGGLTALVRPAWSVPLMGLCAGLALAVFFLYDRLPQPRTLLLGGGAVVLVVAAVAAGGGGRGALVTSVLACAGVTGLLTVDYTGSTPLEGSKLFEERQWHVTLDLDRCEGVFSCWEVCPEACFEKRQDVRKIALAYDERCIRCGACVVQCPQDALAFENEVGERVEPETIRRFKLNLLGRRTVAAHSDASSESP